MLDEKLDPTSGVAAPARDAFPLRVVERGERSGFVIPHHAGVAAYRGSGPADYTCGRCGSPLAMGVRPGMFRTFIFSCSCGALNAVE